MNAGLESRNPSLCSSQPAKDVVQRWHLLATAPSAASAQPKEEATQGHLLRNTLVMMHPHASNFHDNLIPYPRRSARISRKFCSSTVLRLCRGHLCVTLINHWTVVNRRAAGEQGTQWGDVVCSPGGHQLLPGVCHGVSEGSLDGESPGGGGICVTTRKTPARELTASAVAVGRSPGARSG